MWLSGSGSGSVSIMITEGRGGIDGSSGSSAMCSQVLSFEDGGYASIELEGSRKILY